MADPMVKAQKLLQKHFPKFGTFRKTCSFKEMDDSNYNTSAGSAAEVVLSTQPGVEVILASPSINQGQYARFSDEFDVQVSDRMGIVPFLDLDVIPKPQDQLVDPDGVVWVVEGVVDDPGPVHYEMLLRPRR